MPTIAVAAASRPGCDPDPLTDESVWITPEDANRRYAETKRIKEPPTGWQEVGAVVETDRCVRSLGWFALRQSAQPTISGGTLTVQPGLEPGLR